jgi:ABC-2 type transport system ATP-binding protein
MSAVEFSVGKRALCSYNLLTAELATEVSDREPQAMNSIFLHSVHKVFRSGFLGAGRVETYALRGVSLSVLPGEIISILGPNGSGKSTMLRLISTVLLPDRGAVVVNGADTRTNAQSVRKQVGFAMASERSFFPRLTVRENLMFFATLENVSWRERAGRADEALHQTGLEVHSNKQVMKLSSGMHQRLGIARALIKRPRVLLLDEASRSLDPAAATQLWNLISTLGGAGITIVLASHNFAEAVAVSDRIAILQKGELLGACSARNVTVEALQRFYRELTEEGPVNTWREGVPA